MLGSQEELAQLGAPSSSASQTPKAPKAPKPLRDLTPEEKERKDAEEAQKKLLGDAKKLTVRATKAVNDKALNEALNKTSTKKWGVEYAKNLNEESQRTN